MNRKLATIDVVKRKFQEKSTRAANALQGFQQFIDICDNYIDSPKPETLTRFLDSLLGSHLLGLKSTIEGYMPIAGETSCSHVSLKKDEIDTYYTQDSRLDALAEIYYIVNYIRPIAILIKVGQQPDDKDWGFAKNLQQYINGTLTLDDPSVFLLDGFLYQKGLEKAGSSLVLLKRMAKMNGTMNTEGILDGNVEVESLLPKEKTEAIEEYNVLYQLHRDRVEVYIKNLEPQNFNNIKKSRTFLEATLTENSKLSLVPEIITTQLESVKPRKKRKKRKKKREQSSQQQQRQNVVPNVTSQTIPVVVFHKEETIINAISIPTPQLTEQLEVDTQSVLQPLVENLQEKPLIQESAPLCTTLHLMPEPLPSPPSTETTSSTQIRVIKEKKKENTQGNRINNRSRNILTAILDTQSSPFTISYTQALNAMSKIGITELPPKRKGDFRKLVRRDSNEEIIGKVFAYSPATSTLGKELMSIYRVFIQEQLEDRLDIDRSFW